MVWTGRVKVGQPLLNTWPTIDASNSINKCTVLLTLLKRQNMFCVLYTFSKGTTCIWPCTLFRWPWLRKLKYSLLYSVMLKFRLNQWIHMLSILLIFWLNKFKTKCLKPLIYNLYSANSGLCTINPFYTSHKCNNCFKEDEWKKHRHKK